MRALRTLAAAGLTVSLLATPVTTAAQDGAPLPAFAPLARQPGDVLPLQGTPWRLEAYRHRDGDGIPGPEVAAFLRFGPSAYDGSGGCSRIRGQYGTIGAALELKPKQVDRRSCAEQAAVVQDAVEAGLRKSASYEVVPGPTPADDELVLRSAGGEELLRYGLDDVSGLDWAEWRLASYTIDGQPVAASTGMPAVMTFEPDEDAFYKRRQSGRFSGSTGCNGVVAQFYRSADVLSFSDLERTGAPCTAELAAQEEAIVAVLDATSMSLELPYDRLRLTSSDSGEQLEFVSRTPLEGSTWIVDGSIGGTRTDTRVTLRLEDGAATGEGPCGAFSASYATDGVFITFRDVQGARDGDCPESRAEKALLDALRGAVTVARTSDRLDLVDARAERVLRFGRPFAP
jgi:heat shock protein HslJ